MTVIVLSFLRLRPTDPPLIRIRSIAGATTKNYQSRETVLTPTTAQVFRMLPPQGSLFPFKQRTFEARFYDFKKRHKIDWDLHSLRHAFVTKLRNANIPERVVAHYVGHAQKNVTDRYTSYTREFVEAATRAADFGSEFLSDSENVVTIWPSAQTEQSEQIQALAGDRRLEANCVGTQGAPAFQNKLKINSLDMPGAGLEPARPFRGLGF